MLATLISAPPQAYITTILVRFVACVALVGVGFLLSVGRECHSENMKTTCLGSSERTKYNLSEITEKLGMARRSQNVL